MPKKTVVTKEEIDDVSDQTDIADANEGVSLFDVSAVDEHRIERIAVYRKDPDEGYLGELEPTATEEDIKRAWGGSVYFVQGKNAQGKVAKSRSVRISGDPIFVSLVAENRWRRANQLPPLNIHTGNDNAHRKPGDDMSIKDMLLLMEEKEQARRREADEREAKDRREREEREEKERKWLAEREDHKRKEDDEREERRRVAQREEDERRARQHREDIDRMNADNQRMMQSQTQMFQQSLALMKTEQASASKQDPLDVLLKGMAIAREMGGEQGGNNDPLSILLGNAPAILSELRQTAGAAIREVRGNGAGAAEDSGGAEDGSQGDPGVTFTGRSAVIVREVAKRLQAEGKDPEKFFQGMGLMYLKSRGMQLPAAGGGSNGASARNAPGKKKPFKKGGPGGPGRPKGSKNRPKVKKSPPQPSSSTEQKVAS
jgi:hypothetical protein